MKLVHLSDLHLGKRVNEFSMTEQQVYILAKITDIIRDEKPDAVIIAGDIYDKSVPPAEAVRLFDDFITEISGMNIPVLAISGNHDSADRIAFGSRLMNAAGVYFSPVYSGEIIPVRLSDEYGAVNFYMLPFIKPSDVRGFFPDKSIESYDDAVRAAVGSIDIDFSERNVIIAHQFVTGAERCESESVSVGGTDNISAEIFEPFDYAALGHIHGAQHISSPKIRYCGTPLKYSFSEISHKKSVTIAELKEKGSLEIRTVPLIPQNDMREIKGTYRDLTDRSFYNEKNRYDFISAVLTDGHEIPNAVGKLRAVYPNLMKLEYDDPRARSERDANVISEADIDSPEKLFGSFYELCNKEPMTAEQKEYVSALVGKLWDE